NDELCQFIRKLCPFYFGEALSVMPDCSIAKKLVILYTSRKRMKYKSCVYLAERRSEQKDKFFEEKERKKIMSQTRQLTTIAMFVAIGIIGAQFLWFPAGV